MSIERHSFAAFKDGLRVNVQVTSGSLGSARPSQALADAQALQERAHEHCERQAVARRRIHCRSATGSIINCFFSGNAATSALKLMH